MGNNRTSSGLGDSVKCENPMTTRRDASLQHQQIPVVDMLITDLTRSNF